MIRTYLKIAWRNILNGRLYSVINILGLGTGMAVALLIGLWVHSVYFAGRSLPDYEQLYQIRLFFTASNNVQRSAPMPLAAALGNFPEIQYVAETDQNDDHVLVAGDKKLSLSGTEASADFLKIFQYPLVRGDANTVLSDPNSIVLTESTAKSLFGDDDAFGKTVRVDNNNSARVTGILKDLPGNASFHFNYLLPLSYYNDYGMSVKKAQTDWSYNAFLEYVKLKPHVSYEQIEGKIKNIMLPHDQAGKPNVYIQPIKDWGLYSLTDGLWTEGFVKYVRMFTIIGILVLLIACINFINLSTARSEKRAREIGVRKAIGSRRKDIVFQFLMESFLITWISFLVSILLAQLTLPWFNSVSSRTLSIPWSSPGFWLLMIGYILLTSLISGSRPAFFLSSFSAVKALKGTIVSGTVRALPRKLLVVLQFTCSIALIISTIIVYRQIQYAKDRPTGYEPDHLVMTDINQDLSKNFVALRDDLINSGAVTEVTKASGPVTNFTASLPVKWSGQKDKEYLELGVTAVSENYFKTVGMSIKEGRDFSGAPGDSSAIILNEAAVKVMRFKNPLNQLVTIFDANKPNFVVGVVKDAITLSPFKPAAPTVFILNPKWEGTILYRLKGGVNTRKAMDQVTAIFNKYSPNFPFSYQFADDAYSSKFKNEVFIGSLAGYFAIFAILISCLGLYGLAAYIAEQKVKEIGIRKVLGASITSLWMLLSRDFLILVLISCLIASPISIYFLSNWIQSYAYRITIGPGVFLFSAGLALMIALATVSFQIISAARENPVDSLKVQ
jgi:putative ABC transport system permease protein